MPASDYKKPKGKKRVMKEFKITEISGVDTPAQAGARVTILKRDDRKPTDARKGMGDLVDLLTSIEEGHQHGISINRGDDNTYIWVSHAVADNAEVGHSHEISMGSNGMYVISTVAGHTHSIDTAALNEKLLSTMTKGEDKTMPKTVEELQTSLDTANASLKKANKIIGLSGTEKAHFDTLDETGKDSFLAKSAEDRTAEIAAVEKAKTDDDPVVYTTMDGLEIRKSAGEVSIALAKRSDKLEKQNQKLQADAEQTAFEKRATDELPHLAGKVEDRAALIKAVDAIDDKGQRERVHAILKADNEAMSLAYQTAGVGGEKVLNKDGPEGKLDKMAKEIEKAEGIPYEKAYKKAINSEEGKKLYAESLN